MFAARSTLGALALLAVFSAAQAQKQGAVEPLCDSAVAGDQRGAYKRYSKEVYVVENNYDVNVEDYVCKADVKFASVHAATVVTACDYNGRRPTVQLYNRHRGVVYRNGPNNLRNAVVTVEVYCKPVYVNGVQGQ